MATQHAPAHRGLATSTDTTYKYAKLYFDIFGMSNLGEDFELFDELINQNRQDILCDKAMWILFGTWLHTHCRQLKDQAKHIDSGVALSTIFRPSVAITSDMDQ